MRSVNLKSLSKLISSGKKAYSSVNLSTDYLHSQSLSKVTEQCFRTNISGSAFNGGKHFFSNSILFGKKSSEAFGLNAEKILHSSTNNLQRSSLPNIYKAALSDYGRQIALKTLKYSTVTEALPNITNAGFKGTYSTMDRALSLVSGGSTAQRAVSAWLFGCAGWVFSLVVLGGVTRLTRSGLSMTDWRFTGTLPPLTLKEWEFEFEKYKLSPEYKRVNRGMSLDEFKFIYWMEYAHRMWGRTLGLLFIAPFSYFAFKGYITRPLSLRLGILFTLGGAQGFVGWWMVKSGLEEPKSEHVIPKVSPYRLATHLASAFVIYSGILWTALSVSMPASVIVTNSQSLAASKARKLVLPLSALIGLTALSGAFVAGNDAGHAYNTFPKMGDEWIPSSLLEMNPIIKNFFENTATVQFDHRILALSTMAAVSSVWFLTSHLPLHPSSSLLLNSLLGMTAIQVGLGIATLLNHVPVWLGSSHQAGALVLFTISLSLIHTLRPNLARSKTQSLVKAGLSSLSKS